MQFSSQFFGSFTLKIHKVKKVVKKFRSGLILSCLGVNFIRGQKEGFPVSVNRKSLRTYVSSGSNP